MELTPPIPRLETLCHLTVTVAAPQMIGAVLTGERRIIPITGGRSFETGAPKYAWLNRLLAVCSGARAKEEVLLDFYEVK
jgi:hypothetical protein